MTWTTWLVIGGIEKRKVEGRLVNLQDPVKIVRRSRAAFLPPPPETHADKLSERKLLPRNTMQSYEYSYGVPDFSEGDYRGGWYEVDSDV